MLSKIQNTTARADLREINRKLDELCRMVLALAVQAGARTDLSQET